MAIEMMFAGDSPPIGEIDPLYYVIRKNKNRLISRNAKPFPGYMRDQSSMYQRKGNRLDAVHNILGWAKNANSSGKGKTRLVDVYGSMRKMVEETSHTALVEPDNADKNSGQTKGMIDVCGKRLHITCTVSSLITLLESLEARYGERSCAGTWRLQGHRPFYSNRIPGDKILLYRTYHLSRPEADLIRRLRKEEISLDDSVDMMHKQEIHKAPAEVGAGDL